MEYNYKDYERPSVAADVVTFGIDSEKAYNKRELDDKKLKILLVKRGEEPYKNLYSLPGGFLRPSETVEQSALRELKEETGLENAKLITLKTYSEQARDPRGWVISCAFIALTRTIELNTDDKSDAESAEWLTVEMRNSVILIDDGTVVIKIKGGKASSEELAFDHAQIIYDAYLKLRDEAKTHDIVFDLLPEYFTIANLQKPYEMITGKKEAPANFRRKMSGKIVETEFYDDSKAMHRPSRLYKRRTDE